MSARRRKARISDLVVSYLRFLMNALILFNLLLKRMKAFTRNIRYEITKAEQESQVFKCSLLGAHYLLVDGNSVTFVKYD